MISPPSTAFPLSHGIKRPRIKNEKYLDFIRDLPCVLTGAQAEAAHVRSSSLIHGKRETGKGERPDDLWAIPLCPEKHRLGKDAQHTMNEMLFWASEGVPDPFVICALLYVHFCRDDREAAEMVCHNARFIGKVSTP